MPFFTKKNLGQNFFYQIIFFHPKFFGSESFLTQHFVGGIVLLTEKIWVKKKFTQIFLDWKRFLTQTNLGRNVFLPQKNWVGIFDDPKEFGSDIFC